MTEVGDMTSEGHGILNRRQYTSLLKVCAYRSGAWVCVIVRPNQLKESKTEISNFIY